jgi:hypothetical protein
MGLSSDERERRIQHDPGDPADLVYSRPTLSARVYHEMPTCSTLDPEATDNAELREWSRGQAQDRLKAPCRVCVLEDVWSDDHSAATSEGVTYWRSKVEQLREQEHHE